MYNMAFFFFLTIWLFMCLLPEFIQPVKERPRTDCAVARRMVTRALGIQGRGRVQRYWGVPTSTTGERANNSDRLGFRFPQLTCWKYFYDTEALVTCQAFHFIENIMLSHIHPCIQNKNRQQPTSILELPHLEKQNVQNHEEAFSHTCVVVTALPQCNQIPWW